MGTEKIPWELRRRGLKDSLRHDQRVKDAIRKNLRELIAEEAIITSDGTKKIRIPLRYLDQYRFKYGQPQNGVGQGGGKPGDLLGRRGDGQDPSDGMAGDQPGEHTYEVEFSLDELAQMMLEDLSLPWLEEKPERQIETVADQRFDSMRRRGPMATLDKRRTLIENLKRHAARGDPHIGAFDEDDRRHRVTQPRIEHHSNAAVYMLMDVSGSMTTDKKYIAKSFYFWMVRFLRLKYRTVDTMFIAHDTVAQMLTEQDFFGITQGGGTRCSSAYELALAHIAQHHPSSRWNTYVFHFSDGDNLPDDNVVCRQRIEDLLACTNMVGYGEIKYHGTQWDASFTIGNLYKAFQDIINPHFVSAVLSNGDDVYGTLKKFLQREMGEI